VKPYHFWRRPKRRRHTDRSVVPSSRIAAGSLFQGEIRGQEGFWVQGEVIGDGVFDGTVFLDDGACWRGSILADRICVAGRFDGQAEARIKIELLSTAVLTGNLTCPVIAIAEGAVVEGTINHPRNTQITRFRERRAAVADHPADRTMAGP